MPIKTSYSIGISTTDDSVDVTRVDNQSKIRDIDELANESLAARFISSCEVHAGQCVVSTGGEQFTYQRLFEHCVSFAAHLQELPEFESENHVGVQIGNSIEYLIAFYGTLLAGGVVVPIPMTAPIAKREQLCRLSDTFVVADVAACNSPEPQIQLTVGGKNATRTTVHIARGVAKFTDLRRRGTQPEELAMLMFTSGSSGEPKAVMLSHQNLVANCDSICQFLPITKSDRALAITPFAHALGNSVLQTHVMSGATLVIEEDLKFPAEQLQALQKHKCSSLTAVPEVMENLGSLISQSSLTDGSLRYLAVAGGRMDPDRALDLQDRIAPANLFLMYGQTEATARLAYLRPDRLGDSAHTIGCAIPNVSLEVRDSENRSLPAGQTGVLHARGPNVMLGYYNDSKATSEVMSDGWLNTGDLAKIGKDGLIEICGRESGLVKVQGYRFHPLEVEQITASVLHGAQIVVVPFSFFGHTRLALCARVRDGGEPEPKGGIEPAMLKQICEQNLAPYMMPQRYEIIESWPLNAGGKIDRKALASRFSKPHIASEAG